MQIRPLDPSDHPDALAIWLAASRVGHPFLTPEDLARQQALVAEVYLPQAENWVAVEHGRILGFIGLLDAFVGGLFVAPEVHGRGVGRALIAHAHGLKGPLTVEVYADNPIAPAFYQRCGFSVVGRKAQDDEGRPLPLLVLRQSSEVL